MSKHLPECIYVPEEFDPEQNIIWGGKPCICEDIHRAIGRALHDNAVGLGVQIARRARERALDAAREAVDGLDKYVHGQISAADALDAIDALREKP